MQFDFKPKLKTNFGFKRGLKPKSGLKPKLFWTV